MLSQKLGEFLAVQEQILGLLVFLAVVIPRHHRGDL